MMKWVFIVSRETCRFSAQKEKSSSRSAFSPSHAGVTAQNAFCLLSILFVMPGADRTLFPFMTHRMVQETDTSP
ncbi:hypothetical protein AD948_13110 [Acetobacter senegalensis]|uniref:Uncharacterized protein n=1 Tax=Acetobacter senegalensis TaxID=446692 RepID=A0A149TXH5_9PROT|nr:hypothetical protein AD948_13110 [Acetobacter senegalensis]